MRTRDKIPTQAEREQAKAKAWAEKALRAAWAAAEALAAWAAVTPIDLLAIIKQVLGVAMNWTPEKLDDLRLVVGKRRGEDYPRITKGELAKRLDCRAATISAWYRGEKPSERNQLRLAELLEGKR